MCRPRASAACLRARPRGVEGRGQAPWLLGSAMAVSPSAVRLQRCVVSPAGRHSASLIFLHGSGAVHPRGLYPSSVLRLGKHPLLRPQSSLGLRLHPGSGRGLPPPGRVSSFSMVVFVFISLPFLVSWNPPTTAWSPGQFSSSQVQAHQLSSVSLQAQGSTTVFSVDLQWSVLYSGSTGPLEQWTWNALHLQLVSFLLGTTRVPICFPLSFLMSLLLDFLFCLLSLNLWGKYSHLHSGTAPRERIRTRVLILASTVLDWPRVSSQERKKNTFFFF